MNLYTVSKQTYTAISHILLNKKIDVNSIHKVIDVYAYLDVIQKFRLISLLYITKTSLCLVKCKVFHGFDPKNKKKSTIPAEYITITTYDEYSFVSNEAGCVILDLVFQIESKMQFKIGSAFYMGI